MNNLRWDDNRQLEFGWATTWV